MDVNYKIKPSQKKIMRRSKKEMGRNKPGERTSNSWLTGGSQGPPGLQSANPIGPAPCLKGSRLKIKQPQLSSLQEDDEGKEAEMSCDKSRGSAALSSRAVMRQRGESPAPRRRTTKGEARMGGREGGEDEEKLVGKEQEEVQKGSAVIQSVTQTTNSADRQYLSSQM